MKLGVLKIGVDVAAVVDKQSLEQQYPKLFQGVGKLNSKQVSLHINPEVKPVAQPLRRIPFNLRGAVEARIKQLMDMDIIEPVDGPTPWVNPVVIVPKADKDVRLCLDMRRANQAIERERYPIPTVDEILQGMNGSTVFSKLDLKWGYHQLELSPESRGITTFAVHNGVYRYKRLIFGVCSASEQYQHEVANALAGIEGVENISDDIIVHAQDQDTHDKRLHAVLTRLMERGLTLNPDKCQFNMDKLVFMGILLSEKRIGPTEERVRAVAEAREPENAADQREKHHHGSDEYVRFVAVSATPKALTTREVEEASATDPELIEVRKAITNGRFENCKAYAAVANELCVVGYLVLRGTRIVLPRSLHARALTLAHEGHLGIVGTKQHLRTKVWWPGMDRAAEKHCKECHGCQIVSRPDPPELLRPTPLPDGPLADLAVDLLGPLPSNHSILVVVDYYSRYYEYDILTSTTTEKVIDSLESIFSRHGLPVTLKSDNGPQFKSELFRVL
ncbi:hypothetical protein AAFF_G00172220 [Aldrovandia affinis]|uniref:Gypsy retrotransposon integrase-like protein 1 n=1 Tax=Aldrovandia affinis TaxID=143900 RepID=A0AAD7T0R6_9TELE|nr:hypothetical protein AAFF_G00172220 [Aldrovandia affinis]